MHRSAGYRVSVIAMNGLTFELDTLHGRMMTTMLSWIAQFKRNLISEEAYRAVAKSDWPAQKVLQAVNKGRSCHQIVCDLGISKNTIASIVRQHQEGA